MPLDVACKCGRAFCFQCKEEAHRPVRCLPEWRMSLLIRRQLCLEATLATEIKMSTPSVASQSAAAGWQDPGPLAT